MDLDGLLDLAAARHGFVHYDDARAHGASAKLVRAWVARGEWERHGRRLLRRAGAPWTKASPLMRAVLDAGPGAFLSTTTAAAWWGVPGFDLLRIHVERPRNLAGGVPTYAHVLHEVLDLTSDQVTVLDGVPIVRPERMVFELFGSVHPERAARAAETAWAKGLLSGGSLARLFEQFASRGRAGTVATREFLETHPPGWVPPASNVEARFAWIMGDGDCGRFRRQVDLGADRWVGRVDFLHEELPLVVEVQSERYHAALLDQAHDAARRAALEAAGFEVVEVWDSWVWHDGRRVVRAVHDGLRRARARGRARAA